MVSVAGPSRSRDVECRMLAATCMTDDARAVLEELADRYAAESSMPRREPLTPTRAMFDWWPA